jgi:hypothetical protein
MGGRAGCQDEWQDFGDVAGLFGEAPLVIVQVRPEVRNSQVNVLHDFGGEGALPIRKVHFRFECVDFGAELAYIPGKQQIFAPER